ncbi:MAG: hypothetical protein ACOX4O_12505 [Eubacteriales bacterium]|jgi:alpha-L-rhamnosidase
MIDSSAKWIWADKSEPNQYVLFSLPFKASAGEKLTLSLSVDSQYAVYLNGEFLDWGQWGDFPEYKTYDELDISRAAMDGDNRLDILCTWYGIDTFSYRVEPAGLIFSLYSDGKLIASSGSGVLCGADSRWKREGVSYVTGQIGWSFVYDSTLPPPEMSAAREIEKAATLVPRPIKKLMLTPEKKAVVLCRGPFIAGKENPRNMADELMNAYLGYECIIPRPVLPGKMICRGRDSGIYVTADLREQSAGLLSLDFTVKSKTKVMITWGEHLDDCRVRSSVGGRCFAAEYMAHEGDNRFIWPIRRLGLRYMQVFFFSGEEEVEVRYLGIKETDYPLDMSGKFICSDNLHNRIAEVSKRTLLMCMHEHYEDSPWREQALYNMDSRNQMLFGYYAFGETDFVRGSLKLFALGVREDGLIDICAPSRFVRTIPSFNAIFPLQSAEYLRHSGDKAFLSEILPALKRVCAAFEARIGENGLIRKFEDDSRYWDFFEWMTGLYGESRPDKEVYALPLNAFFSMAADGMAYICRELGDSDADKFASLHESINAAVNRVFWDDAKNEYFTYLRDGRLEHKAELSQALAVCCGVAKGDRLESCLSILSRTVGGVESGLSPVPPDSEEMHPLTISHIVYKYEALMRRPEKYAKQVFADIARVFGYMLYRNATTFWETIDGGYAFGDAGSLCHGWSAVPVYMYWRYAAGYRIESKTIEPVECGLGEIKALPTAGLNRMFGI